MTRRPHAHAAHAADVAGRAATVLLAALAGVLLVAALLWWPRSPAAGARPARSAGPASVTAVTALHAEAAAAGTLAVATAAATAADAEDGAADARAGRLSLLVLSAAGQPLRLARVALWPPGPVSMGDDWPPHEPLRVATTDAGGRCVLLVNAPDQQLVADRDGAGTSGLWSVAEARAAADASGLVSLMLQPPALVSGSVQRADGRPARDTLVLCASAGTPAGPGRARLPDPLRTDAHGEFRLLLDPGGLFRIMASAGGVFSPEERVTARAGENTRLTLAFTADYAIAGLLLDPEGRPAASGHVTCWADAQLAHHEQGQAPEDRPSPQDNSAPVSEGQFRIALAAPGRYTLVAADGLNAPSAALHVDVTELQPKPVVTLMLGEPALISGTVLSADGELLHSAIVTAVPAAWRFEHEEAGAPDATALYGARLTGTNERGEFVLGGLHPAASYRLTVQWSEDGHGATPQEARASARGPLGAVLPDVPAGSSELRVIATAESRDDGVLTGRVMSAEPDAKVAGRRVVAYHANPLDGSIQPGPGTTTDADGSFRLDHLSIGERYALSVADVGRGWSTSLTEEDWFTLTATTGERVVQVVRSASLAVSVRDEAGTPIPGATVSVRCIGAPERADRWAPIRSDEQGRVVFGELAPGRYELRATRGAWQRTLTADFTDGEQASVTLALQRQD